jgi:cell division control protein 6
MSMSDWDYGLGVDSDAKKSNDIQTFIEKYPAGSSVFINKKYLSKGYSPKSLKELLHRSREVNMLMDSLKDAMFGDVPNNIFIYGKTGTGKSTVTNAVTAQLEEDAQTRNINVMVAFVDCESVKTRSRVINDINTQILLKTNIDGVDTRPINAFDAYFKLFCNILRSYDGIPIIIFDEIDKLVDLDIIGILSRVKEKKYLDKNICIIGITNDLKFLDDIDPRIKTVLSQSEHIFQPYNANQLRDILSQRAQMAFKPNMLEDSVIPLCAAYAAQEHGDARKAIDLLRISAEIAEKCGELSIRETHTKQARETIESDRMIEAISTLPTQPKLLLASCILQKLRGQKIMQTGEVYEMYKGLSQQLSIDVLTMRRVVDILSELDMLGIINATIVSKGKYGRTREIYLSFSAKQAWEMLMEDNRLAPLKELHNIFAVKQTKFCEVSENAN